MTGRLKNEAGFALILTLVITALMVAVLVEMIHQVYVDTSLSRGFRDGQQASILAESGATGGAKLLQLAISLSGHSSYTSLSDRWATPLKLDDEVGSLEITIAEESGKININGVVGPNSEFTLSALKRLGQQDSLQIPENAWEALADWIDDNDQTRSGGAETEYYMSLTPPYRAHNSKLNTLTELSLVKGFTPELVHKLRTFVTIYDEMGNSTIATSKVNINTAPKEVLMALDSSIAPRAADQIIVERNVQPFKLPSELSRVSGMDTLYVGLIGKIGTDGKIFKITSLARVKESGRTVEAVVRLSPPAILSWQEY